jgi:myosin protein heavy chain
MEYDPRNATMEIERLKNEIASLKKEERPLSELNATLSGLQQKYEKFKDEKRVAEIQLNERLQSTKSKIQEASYEKDKLEKDFINLNYSLKNAKISIEEANELLNERQTDLGNANRAVIETEEMVKQREGELARATKEHERMTDERKVLKTDFNKYEDDLKTQLKLEKELEDEGLQLDLNEAKLRAEIAMMEKEIEENNAKELALNQKLKADEQEQERLEKFAKEMDREIMEINTFNEKLASQKEDLIFKLKQETQKNLKLENSLKQFQAVFAASEENLAAIMERLVHTDEKLNTKNAERVHNLAMLEEDKKDLTRMIKMSEEKREYLVQIHDTHKELAERLEHHSRNNKFAEFKGELLKILE